MKTEGVTQIVETIVTDKTTTAAAISKVLSNEEQKNAERNIQKSSD